jgi:FKBP-type peptidyl-prolyl cis-trans isomerase SlyD
MFHISDNRKISIFTAQKLNMKISKDKVVSLSYELRLDHKDGEIVETLKPEGPLVFIYGSGNLLPKFEENISGLLVGDQFNFSLAASEAYGEINQEAIVNIPISVFEIDGKIDDNMLKIGSTIPMQDSSGNRLTGKVAEVSTESVKMDFNHPLAGNHLFFKGEITDIRDATEEELQHGHAHFTGSCDNCETCGGHEHCE